MFYNSFKGNKVFHDFCPHSYLVVRLPFSGLVKIYKTTDVMRSCVHSERDLIEDLRDELCLEEAEVTEEPIKISVYYPTYSTCADCVQRLADFVDEMNEERLIVVLNVKVVNIVGPEHRHQLMEAAKDWQGHPRLKLTSIHGQDEVQNARNLAAVLTRIVSFTQQSGKSRRPLIFLENEDAADNDNLITNFMDVVRGCDLVTEDNADFINRKHLYLNVPMRQLEYTATQCQYLPRRLKFLLNGRDIFQADEVMDKFSRQYIFTDDVEDPLFEQVYKELACIVVNLQRYSVVRVLNSTEPYEHVEELLVDVLENTLRPLSLANLSRSTVFINYVPCCYCIGNILLPFSRTVDWPNLQGVNLDEKYRCAVGDYCPFIGKKHPEVDRECLPQIIGHGFHHLEEHLIYRQARPIYRHPSLVPNQVMNHPKFPSRKFWELLRLSRDCHKIKG